EVAFLPPAMKPVLGSFSGVNCLTSILEKSFTAASSPAHCAARPSAPTSNPISGVPKATCLSLITLPVVREGQLKISGHHRHAQFRIRATASKFDTTDSKDRRITSVKLT